MSGAEVVTLERIHAVLYKDFATIYYCPEDNAEQWFIMPNPAFIGGSVLRGNELIEVERYEFDILGSGQTPQDALKDYQARCAAYDREEGLRDDF